MYMRLAFAVAAHLEPEILVVDEVLAVGDAEFQKKCMGKMGDVAAQGRTVLFVSHNMTAICQLCTRALLLRLGQLASTGPASEIAEQYLSDAKEAVDAIFDLSEHPARRSCYRPLIQSLAVSTPDGRPETTFRPQDGMVVDVGIKLPRPIREPRVALAIEDSHGRRIMTMASYFSKHGLGPLDGEKTVRCTLDQLRLGSGRYLLSVSIGDKLQGLLDSVDGAGWFQVEWDNNYENGEPYLSVYGPVLARSAWQVRQ
jgi:lipopolysaccharide transport system ATP-binding protein